jgi:hypothetical protein
MSTVESLPSLLPFGTRSYLSISQALRVGMPLLSPYGTTEFPSKHRASCAGEHLLDRTHGQSADKLP